MTRQQQRSSRMTRQKSTRTHSSAVCAGAFLRLRRAGEA